jgi:putative tricarboxylic transport membrane protein
MPSTSSNRGDIVSSVVVALAGVYIIWQASHWEYMNQAGPGPGFFPLWYGIVITGLALLLLALRLRTKLPELPSGTGWKEVGRALLAWGGFAASIAVIGWLGFAATFGALTFFVTWGLFRRSIVEALLVAPLLALAFHLAFSVLLQVELPTGSLGF